MSNKIDLDIVKKLLVEFNEKWPARRGGGYYGYKHLDRKSSEQDGAEYCTGVFQLSGKIYATKYAYLPCGYEYGYTVDTLREVIPIMKTVTWYE